MIAIVDKTLVKRIRNSNETILYEYIFDVKIYTSIFDVLLQGSILKKILSFK